MLSCRGISFRSHGRTRIGNELLLVRSHVACVSKLKTNKKQIHSDVLAKVARSVRMKHRREVAGVTSGVHRE